MNSSIQLLAKITLVVTLILLCFTFSCQQKAADAITDTEVKVLNESILKIWNEGNLELVDKIYTSECVRHDCGLPEDVVGINALKDYFISNRTTFPDVNVTIDETVVKGDKIVFRWTLTGTNSGPFGEMPPTGKKVQFSGISIGLIVNGKIHEVWDFYNQTTLLQQLGFTITPPHGQK